MNWHNLSDQEFDEKLKSHLMGKEPPFDPGAWDKMNDKLNSVFSPGGSGGNSTWGLISIVLLLSAVFFWNISNYNGYSRDVEGLVQSEFGLKENTGTEQEQTMPDGSNPADPVEPEYSTDGDDPAHINTNEPGNDQTGLDGGTEPVQADQTSKVLAKAGETGTNGVKPANRALERSASQLTQSGMETTGQTPVESHRQLTNSASSTDRQALAVGTPTEHANSRRIGQASDTQGPTIASGASTVTTDFNEEGLIAKGIGLEWLEEPVVEVSPESVELGESPVLPTESSRWSIGLGFAPDVSLVGFSELSSPGSNINLTLDYRIFPRLSIISGISYSRKLYTAEGDDYNPPEGYWPYGVDPERTEAVCDVLDIPINLRYYITVKDRHSFYASMGISTYIMLREEYEYQYEHSYPNVPRYREIRNENQHLFGIYNLSVGYQRKLNPNWSLEIEPFIKAPLSGIGFGRVNLWSTGTAFTIRYHLP